MLPAIGQARNSKRQRGPLPLLTGLGSLRPLRLLPALGLGARLRMTTVCHDCPPSLSGTLANHIATDLGGDDFTIRTVKSVDV